MTPLTIDLNADVGEGAVSEAQLLPLLTSCSIACGGHVGDRQSVAWTLRTAVEHGLAVGAHPSYPDREGFGRRTLAIDNIALMASIRTQIDMCLEEAARVNVGLSHVKFHGALYNDAARNAEMASGLADLIKSIDQHLAVFGPRQSALETAAKEAALAFVAEGFIDRRYQRDGGLVPRSRSDAVIDRLSERADQAVALATGQPVPTDDKSIVVRAETLCIHSDTDDAVQTAKMVRKRLSDVGIAFSAYRHAA